MKNRLYEKLIGNDYKALDIAAAWMLDVAGLLLRIPETADTKEEERGRA